MIVVKLVVVLVVLWAVALALAGESLKPLAVVGAAGAVYGLVLLARIAKNTGNKP